MDENKEIKIEIKKGATTRKITISDSPSKEKIRLFDRWLMENLSASFYKKLQERIYKKCLMLKKVEEKEGVDKND